MRITGNILFIMISCWWLSCSNPGQPRNLEECHRYFDTALTQQVKVDLKQLSKDDLWELHMGLGLWLRNEWLHGERNKPLLKYFHRLGIRHPDDMSALIMESYWSYLNKIPFDLKKSAQKRIDYWKRIEEVDQATVKALQQYNSPVKYLDKQVPIINIPDRSDEGIYGGERIRYKTGYILRGLGYWNKDNKTLSFCAIPFLDTISLKLALIRFNSFDTIHSIVSRQDTLFVSGKRKEKCKIIKYVNGKSATLSTLILHEKNALDSNGWTKLGIYRNELIAMQKNGVFVFRENVWHRIVSYSLEQFYIRNNYYKANTPIPMWNIEVHGDFIYFLHFRDHGFLRLNLLANDSITDMLEYINHEKSIGTNSYEFIGQNKLMICTDDKNGRRFFITSSKGQFNTHFIGNYSENYTDTLVEPRSVCYHNDTLYLAGTRGVFVLKDNIISPLIKFENDNNVYPWKITPLGNGRFLILNLFGSPQLLDIGKQSVIPIDAKPQNLPIQETVR